MPNDLHELHSQIHSLSKPTVPAARLLRRAWSKRLKHYDGETMLTFALRLQQIGDAEIKRWAKSDDLWWRRAALVSTVPLNNKARGGNGDTPRTLMICEMLIDDREDMVVKAMSWALRELSKRDPQAVQRFVTQHKNTLAARVLREVGNKLRTGKKNPK